MDKQVRHIKLILDPRFHADVIETLNNIEPRMCARIVLELLRAHPEVANRIPASASAPVVVPVSVPVTPTATAAPRKAKVDLSAGFDALG